jgi:pilus assembly protein Flp/PilA
MEGLKMFNGLRQYFLSKLSNKKGQGMVEYALIIGLVAIVVVGVLVALGPEIVAIFQRIIDSLGQVPASPTT